MIFEDPMYQVQKKLTKSFVLGVVEIRSKCIPGENKNSHWCVFKTEAKHVSEYEFKSSNCFLQGLIDKMIFQMSSYRPIFNTKFKVIISSETHHTLLARKANCEF